MSPTIESLSFTYSGDVMPGGVLLLGRGIDQNGVPSEATLRRAEAVRDFYLLNELDPSEVPVVVSGGYSASMPEAPANNMTEADAMAAVLQEAGIRIRSIEPASTCTFTNFANVLEGNHFGGVTFDAERPLAVGAGVDHFRRIRPIGRAAFNLASSAVVNIAPTIREDSLAGRVKELAGIPMTTWALRGQDGQSPEGLRAAQQRFESIGPGMLRVINRQRTANAA